MSLALSGENEALSITINVSMVLKTRGKKESDNQPLSPQPFASGRSSSLDLLLVRLKLPTTTSRTTDQQRQVLMLGEK